jgi:hypothetical protein
MPPTSPRPCGCAWTWGGHRSPDAASGTGAGAGGGSVPPLVPEPSHASRQVPVAHLVIGLHGPPRRSTPAPRPARGRRPPDSSVGYRAPAQVPRGTGPVQEPGHAGGKTAGGPGRRGPAPFRRRPLAGKHLGGGHAALRQFARQRLKVGIELEPQGWLPPSRSWDSARMRSWSSAAASATFIGRLLARETGTAASSPNGRTLARCAGRRYRTAAQQ